MSLHSGKAFLCLCGTGGGRYWLLNVGDIKPAELGMKTFFGMAWNVKAFSPEHAMPYQARYQALAPREELAVGCHVAYLSRPAAGLPTRFPSSWATPA